MGPLWKLDFSRKRESRTSDWNLKISSSIFATQKNVQRRGGTREKNPRQHFQAQETLTTSQKSCEYQAINERHRCCIGILLETRRNNNSSRSSSSPVSPPDRAITDTLVSSVSPFPVQRTQHLKRSNRSIMLRSVDKISVVLQIKSFGNSLDQKMHCRCTITNWLLQI